MTEAVYLGRVHHILCKARLGYSKRNLHYYWYQRSFKKTVW